MSIILAVVLVVAVVAWWRRRRPSPRYQVPKRAGVGRLTQGVDGRTRRQLLRLVGGNQKTAQRLVTTVQDRYPGRSEQWCWEKAIYDIQRDRRS